MRRLAIPTLLAVVYLAAAAPRATDASASRVAAGAGISVRVPRGWHVVRGWLSDVVDPMPRLAIASFPVKLSRHSCECGEPNVVNFPRAGAFLFVWERLDVSRAQLRRLPRRPARFRIAQDMAQRYECAGPSWETIFRESGREFQVEVYLGPAAGAKLRVRMGAVLDSLDVTSRTLG